ncbi:beta-mannosidase [Actinophytocola sp.]|uniref:glycoside hydrolase 5 family protein n=1 Tax=Actinophytocola sp. TaxID=1872138 RepID=UPI002ED33E29
MRRDGPKLPGWLGANFWSRTGGPLMWRNYDPAVVRDELEVLRQHHVTVTRSFFYWPDFHPAPDVIDDGKVAHFLDFLDAHSGKGMSSIPTFIVGHMSGENWDPSWRDGRDLYADVWLVSRQAWFIEQMVRRLHRHPAVAGWLISNEMPIYGRRRGEEPAPIEDVTSWATIVTQAVRAGGATQPVSLGDGAWGIEVTGVDNGFSLRETGPLVDFVGPHVYRMDSDPIRQHLNAAFICELSAVTGKPVVLEEFGTSSDWASDDNAAHYYRQTLHNTLLAGASGWLAWNNTDYDLEDQDPYRHHPFELHFGVTTHAGKPKPQLLEMWRFGSLLSKLDFPGLRREDSQTALVVPSYLERGYPYGAQDDRELIFGALRQAYVAAREADLPVAFAREEDGLADDASLYLLPSCRQVLAPTLRRLGEFATVYLSYCSGTHDRHRGPWFPMLNEMFGVEHQLAYGLNNPIEDEVVELTFVTAFGSIPEGEVLRFRAGGNEHSRAYLPVRPREAEILAVDGRDRPALLRKGNRVLCTYPLEHMAATNGHVNPEPTYRLYDALATVAGVQRPVRVEDPRVLADTMTHTDGRRFAWLVSQHPNEVTVTPTLPGATLHTLDGNPVTAITLAPYDVQVFRMEHW